MARRAEKRGTGKKGSERRKKRLNVADGLMVGRNYRRKWTLAADSSELFSSRKIATPVPICQGESAKDPRDLSGSGGFGRNTARTLGGVQNAPIAFHQTSTSLPGVFFGLVGGTPTNYTTTVIGLRFINIPQPTVKVQVKGSDATVSWPAAAVGWVLKSSDTLDPDSWQPVPMSGVLAEEGAARITCRSPVLSASTS